MSKNAEVCYTFKVEWYDSQAEMVRPYLLQYYPGDQSLDMYDIKSRRTFLKRCSYPSVKLSDLFIGAQFTVYARQLKVVEFGNEFTKRELSTKQSRNLVLIRPAAFQKIGDFIDMIYKEQFVIGQLKMVNLNQQQACQFFGDDRMTERAASLTGGPVVAMEIVGQDVPSRLSFGNAAYMSSGRDVDMELQYIFHNPRIPTTAQITKSTVCIIKPHAIMSGVAGQVIARIMNAGYHISAMEMFALDTKSAEEFLEVYKGVSVEYYGMVQQLAGGPCIALEVQGGEEVVAKFRAFCGPSDSEVARHIRPGTLRADFGIDKVKNGVHCTDLVEDGGLEAEYFFSILQKFR